MKIKKFTAILLFVAMISSLFAGCGSKKTSGDGDGKEGEVVEIKWMFWDDLEATTDKMSLGYGETIKRFNETYKDKYHVTAVTTNLDDYMTKLNALIAAKDCPDVFICNPGPNMNDVVAAGAAADLSDILKNQEKDWYGTFTNGIFERLTYDGKIMAVPVNFAAALVFYNTEMFEKAGASVPTTYEEWLTCCDKLKAAGYTPISCSAGTPWCLSMLAGYFMDRAGGPDNLKGVNAGTASWKDDSFVKGATCLKELSQYFQETAAGDSNDQATANFYNEQAAMLVQGSWAIGQINGANAAFEDKCGVFSFPAITGGADPNRMIVKTDNLMMSATTKHQDACIALMKMFTDDTAQKYTAEVSGKIPVTSVSFDKNAAPAQLSYVMDILSKSTGTLGFYNESFTTTECGDTFDNAMVSLFLGDSTVDESLDTIEEFFKDNVWKK